MVGNLLTDQGENPLETLYNVALVGAAQGDRIAAGICIRLKIVRVLFEIAEKHLPADKSLVRALVMKT